MTDGIEIPLVITGAGFRPTWFTERIVFELRPPSTTGGFSIREWPLGADGELYTAIGSNELAHLGIALDPNAPLAHLARPTDVDMVDHVEVRMPLGADATVTSSESDGELQWHEVRIDGVAPVHWSGFTDVDLIVATDDDGRLAALRFATPTRRPTDLRVELRSERGWDTSMMRWHQGGEERPGLALSRAQPQMFGSDAAYEHLPSLDGHANLVIVGDTLESIDAIGSIGSIEVPDAHVRRDSTTITLTWPNPDLALTIDTSTEPARARYDFGLEPVTWVQLDGHLLVGCTSDDRLAALVVPAIEQPDGSMMGPDFMDPMANMTQAEMLQSMTAQMAEQHERELEQASRFVIERPFPAFGLVHPPQVDACSMRLVEGPFGPGEAAGVHLTWGDEIARMHPDGDREAPLVTVVHERIIDMGFPDGAPSVRFDEHLGWLLGDVMLRRQWALKDVEDSMVWGPEAHDRQLQELAGTAEPATLVIDGEPHAAMIVRTEHAFVVRAERDGWRTVVRASGFDGPTDVARIEELDRFLAGKAEADARMVAMHEESMRQLEAAEPAPPDAAAMRADAEHVVRELEPNMHGFSRGPRSDDPATLFAPDIVERWGGAAAFVQRIDLATRLADIRSTVVAVARDGSVAQLLVHVHLPRPDGSGVGFAVGIDGDWWDHDADDLRAAAAAQPPRERQGEYDLRFHALAERRSDGTVVITTDLMRLIDEHVGGIERLL